MKPQIALSPEQMAELKSLGMDCSDASMVWKWKGETEPRLHVNTLFDDIRKDYERFGYTPTYTLEDIIFKLEANITYNDVIANQPDTFAGQPVEITPWECSYDKLVGLTSLERTLCCGLCWGKTPMEAAFNALKEVQECFPDKIKKL